MRPQELWKKIGQISCMKQKLNWQIIQNMKEWTLDLFLGAKHQSNLCRIDWQYKELLDMQSSKKQEKNQFVIARSSFPTVHVQKMTFPRVHPCWHPHIYHIKLMDWKSIQRDPSRPLSHVLLAPQATPTPPEGSDWGWVWAPKGKACLPSIKFSCTVVFNVRFREGNISDLLFQRAWLQFAHQFGHDLETQTLCQFNFTHTLKLNPKNCLTSAMSTRKSCQRWWQTVRWFYLSAQNNQDSIVHPKHACQSSMYSQHFLISGCSITSAIQWVIYFPVNPIILSKLMMNGCPMMSRLGLSSGTGRHMKIEVSWSFWVNILETSKHHSSEAKMVYITLSLH